MTQLLFASSSDSWWITSIMTATIGLVTVTALLGVAFWGRYRKYLEEWKPFQELPMPPNSHWLFGQLPNIGGDFRISQPRLALHYANEYGQVGYWVVRTKAVSVTHYEDARAVLNHSNFRRPVPIFRRHVDQFLGPRNIGFLNGKEWKSHRSTILRAFTPTAVQDAQPAILKVMSHLLASLKERAGAAKQQQQSIEMDIGSLMKMITIDVFGQTALSEDLECCRKLESSPLAIAFDYMGDEMSRRIFQPSSITDFFYWIPTAKNRRYQRARKLIRTFLDNLVRERQVAMAKEGNDDSGGPPNNNKDLLDGLLRQEKSLSDDDANSKNGGISTSLSSKQPSSEDTTSDVLMALLFAGYDTTSITLTYALYHIATIPMVEQLCWNELVHPDMDPTNPELMMFCKAIILETLRLYPPAVLTTRSFEKPLKLSGNLLVPVDATCFIPIWTIHRMEQHFERPTEFIPQRWAYQDSNGMWQERFDDDHQHQHHQGENNHPTLPTPVISTKDSCNHNDDCHPTTTTIPPANRKAFFAFSAGSRSCAGSKFAMTEAILILSQLIQHFTFHMVDETYELYPERVGLVQRPRDNLILAMKWRGM